jgi:CheY-like chemotaxis protein
MAGEKILVVDDNPMDLKLMRAVLTAEGYDVTTEEDAENAFVRLKSYLPRLILMDIQLPGMNGLELTQILKADVRTKNTIVIAMTASGMKGNDERAFAAGCDGYIAKPIDIRLLPGVLAQYLAR